jgi:RNA-directed DNA polymerase
MKGAGNLWDTLTGWENLMQATRVAARGKRQRPDVARFLHEIGGNLCRLQSELRDGTYRPGEYRTIVITHPKARTVSARPFATG